MACRKNAGIVVKAEARPPLPGENGFKLIRYAGMDPLRIDSALTGALYLFTPGSQRYVATEDASRVLAYRENGHVVFAEVE